MTPSKGRTQDCNRAQARVRLNQAAAFREVAELVDGEDNDLATLQVSASLAVLAGIAASDAACCAALGCRSRGQDHRQAIALVAQAGPEGVVMSRALSTLLDLKDNAHYGMEFVTSAQVKKALRQSAILVDSATRLLTQE
ncbi:hypothetical protein GCM10029976_049500 [Kribbella albertanoniae]|uniref:DNA-binding protein n=1 Tax=Kribbella albertanoniae TaxID=1266829 RepID=A0A4V2XQQ4_9ACTN|nr:hypothetical protein [Kribbella albertanoniae]TDC26935.1 hypothetical protein E1261_21595 [Kribbella albertanoniae]